MDAEQFLLEFEKDKPRLLNAVSTLEERAAFYHSAHGSQVTIDVMIAFAKEKVKEALLMASKNVKVERISDSRPGQVFNQDNHGQLVISGYWAGEYIRVNRKSIIEAYPLDLIK